MLMTGKLLVSVLLVPLLFGFTGLVAWLYRLFERTFYTGYLEQEIPNLFRKYPCPATCMLDLTEKWNQYVENGLSGDLPFLELGILILFLLVEILLSVCLYRNRRSEARKWTKTDFRGTCPSGVKNSANLGMEGNVC